MQLQTETSDRIRAIKAKSRDASLKIADLTLGYAVGQRLPDSKFTHLLSVENRYSTSHVARVLRGNSDPLDRSFFRS
jgi:hypothetical protein